MQISTYAVEILTAKGEAKILYPRAKSPVAARTAVERQLAQRAMTATITGVRKI